MYLPARLAAHRRPGAVQALVAQIALAQQVLQAAPQRLVAPQLVLQWDPSHLRISGIELKR